uniref:Proxanthoxycyclin-E n=1 Tax=Melicope xanthoxyloides TaxID=1312821 RepID=A0A7H9SKD6_9ROSI|nr:proxanthoxycyclin-E [Melicope xanthoxyloides]
MEFFFAGKIELSESSSPPIFSFHIDEMAHDNLNLLVVPQYGRNPDESG